MFYGLERAIIKRKSKKSPDTNKALEDGEYYWHISIFAIYNLIIGYLFLHDQELNHIDSLLFFIAIAFHFLVNDFAMQSHHEDDYHDSGRWIMGGAVVFGWNMGVVIQVSDLLLSILLAFIVGGITLNILKEELPKEKERHFGAFLMGVLGFLLLFFLGSHLDSHPTN